MERQIYGNLVDSLRGLEDGKEHLKGAHLGNALSQIKLNLPPNSWVGLYLVNDGQLVLGPFQGTPACEEIAFGKGVVGACYEKRATIMVEDVTTFPGYICCDASAKSEICVPVFKGEEVIAILDIDRPDLHDFSNEKEEFEAIAKLLENWL